MTFFLKKKRALKSPHGPIPNSPDYGGQVDIAFLLLDMRTSCIPTEECFKTFLFFSKDYLWRVFWQNMLVFSSAMSLSKSFWAFLFLLLTAIIISIPPCVQGGFFFFHLENLLMTWRKVQGNVIIFFWQRSLLETLNARKVALVTCCVAGKECFC